MNNLTKRYRFILVRHGQSIWNRDNKFTGWTDIPLTLKGKKDALDIAWSLRTNNIYPTHIYTSELKRSVMTSNIIRQVYMPIHIPLSTTWRLNEKFYGTLEGVSREYIKERYGREFTRRMRTEYNMPLPVLEESQQADVAIYRSNYENSEEQKAYFEMIRFGETKMQLYQRTIPYWIKHIHPNYDKPHYLPLIITHKHTARVIMKHIIGMSDETFAEYDLPKDTVLDINVELGKYNRYVFAQGIQF